MIPLSEVLIFSKSEARMYYVVVGLIGALIAVSVSAVSRSNFYIVSALIPFFPFFSLLAYYMAKQRNNLGDLSRVIQFNIASMIPFVAFALSMYFLHTRLDFYPAVGLALVIWFIAAFSTYYIYNLYV
jgi:membrane protein GlpM